MLLEDFFLYEGMDEKGLIATTFASHIARLQELIWIANKMGRQAVFVGRSLAKYTGIAKQLGLIKMKGARAVRSPNAIKKVLAEVSGGRGRTTSSLLRVIRVSRGGLSSRGWRTASSTT